MYSPLQRLMSRHALPGVQYAFAVGGGVLYYALSVRSLRTASVAAE